MKYDVAVGRVEKVAEFVKDVNKKLADGWELYGSLQASTEETPDKRVYAVLTQAMVKDDAGKG